MRDFAKDAQRVVLALLAGFLLYFVVTGLPAGFVGFLLGRYTSSDITALRDTIRITDSVIVARTDTVVKYQRRVDTVHAVSDSLDALVTIRDDSTLVIPDYGDSLFRDTTVHVPAVIVADIRSLRLTVATQDTLIRHLCGRDSTQQWRIETRDKLIAELSRKNPLACGRKCGFALGVLGSIAVYKAVK
jgi:hypothetical protein